MSRTQQYSRGARNWTTTESYQRCRSVRDSSCSCQPTNGPVAQRARAHSVGAQTNSYRPPSYDGVYDDNGTVFEKSWLAVRERQLLSFIINQTAAPTGRTTVRTGGIQFSAHERGRRIGRQPAQQNSSLTYHSLDTEDGPSRRQKLHKANISAALPTRCHFRSTRKQSTRVISARAVLCPRRDQVSSRSDLRRRPRRAGSAL